MPEKPDQVPAGAAAGAGRASTGAMAGVQSATEQAKQVETGEEDKRVAETSGGSDVEIAGGEPKADFAAADAREPVGEQAESAVFGPQGALDTNLVATPTGLMPVSALVNDSKKAEKLLEERKEAVKNEGRRSALDTPLSDDEIERMTGPELRAVAQTRGYKDFPQNGSNAARQAFKAAQKKDDRFKTFKK